MNKLNKILCTLLALTLLCTCTALAEEPAPIAKSCTTSNYLDDTGAWSMQMDWFSTGLLLFSVEHAVSETEYEVWAVSIENTDETANEYIGAYCGRTVIDSTDGAIESSETVYDDGTGSIVFDGELVIWTDHATEEPVVFAMVSAYTASYLKADNGTEMTTYSEDESNSMLTCEIVLTEDNGTVTNWDFVLVWNDTVNAYTYEDGICTRTIIKDDDVSDETLYTDGSGVFALMADGAMQWTTSSANDNQNMLFSVVMVDDQL